MFWPHTKTPHRLQKIPVPSSPPFLSATADKGVQATSNKMTYNNFYAHYFLHFIFAQDKLRLDATSFLQKPKNKLLIEIYARGQIKHLHYQIY
jgi:hypothetical protein